MTQARSRSAKSRHLLRLLRGAPLSFFQNLPNTCRRTSKTFPIERRSRKRKLASAENQEGQTAEPSAEHVDQLVQEAWDALYLQRDTWEETHESHQHFLLAFLVASGR